MDELGGGLVGGEDEDFGDLDVRGCRGGVEGDIGNVVAGEGLDAGVEALGGRGVAMEANVGEVRLDEAGLEVGDADGRLVEVHAESVAEGLDGGFGGAVGAAARIGDVAGYGADVDDVAAAAFDHAGDDESRHHEEGLDVGVDHGEGVVEVALMLLVGAEGETGVVDEDIDVAEVGGKVADGGFGRGAIPNVEGEQVDGGGVALLELLFEGLELFDAAGVEDEAMAGLRELARTGLAYAGGCAGDEGEWHG